MLTAGEKLFNGAIVTPELERAYNAQQARIESFRRAGLQVPEHMLNAAHNLLASAALAALPRRR